MKPILTKYKLELIGLPVGLVAGWCYWYFVGCASESCAITSSPINSSLYGGVTGILLFSLLKKNKS